MEPGPSPLRRICLSAVCDSHFDPFFHFFCYPRDSASAKRYPFGECTRAFEPRDVSRTVGDAIDRFEFHLRYQLPCHRKRASCRQYLQLDSRCRSTLRRCNLCCASCLNPIRCFDQAAIAAAFRFQRQPSRPITPRYRKLSVLAPTARGLRY